MEEKCSICGTENSKIAERCTSCGNFLSRTSCSFTSDPKPVSFADTPSPSDSSKYSFEDIEILEIFHTPPSVDLYPGEEATPDIFPGPREKSDIFIKREDSSLKESRTIYPFTPSRKPGEPPSTKKTVCLPTPSSQARVAALLLPGLWTINWLGGFALYMLYVALIDNYFQFHFSAASESLPFHIVLSLLELLLGGLGGLFACLLAHRPSKGEVSETRVKERTRMTFGAGLALISLWACSQAIYWMMQQYFDLEKSRIVYLSGIFSGIVLVILIKKLLQMMPFFSGILIFILWLLGWASGQYLFFILLGIFNKTIIGAICAGVVAVLSTTLLSSLGVVIALKRCH